MSLRRFSWKLLLLTAIPVLIAVFATVWIVATDAAARQRDIIAARLRGDAQLIRDAVQRSWPAIDANAVATMDALADGNAAFIVVDADGKRLAIAGADTDAAGGATQTDIQATLASGSSEITRWNDLGQARRIVTVRIGSDADHLGVLLASHALPTPLEAIGLSRASPWLIGGIVVTAIAVLAILHTRRSAALLLRITQAARSLSAGDLATRLDDGTSRELELLSRVVNQTRQRLALQVENMERQKRTFESLLQQLREGVVVVDRDGRVVLMNPSALRLLNVVEPRGGRGFVGLAVERCIPQLELQRLLADHRPGAALATDDAARGQWESRLQIETSAGVGHLLAQVSDIVLPGVEDGRTSPTVGRLLVLTDITDLVRTIQIKTDFVANASHELRTPLSTIRAAVEALHNIDFREDADAAGRFVDIIDRQSARLEALASDLLDLARVESNAARFQPRSMSLRDLLSQLQAHFAEPLRRREVRLHLDVADDAGATVHAHPQLLRLVLDNIIDNAIKFSEPGEKVRLAVQHQPQEILFEVADEGCGISPEDQERVFERFYQVERARSGSAAERGTGLGLSIVRHAVNAMEGELTLKSELGVGTRVSVRIPQPR